VTARQQRDQACADAQAAYRASTAALPWVGGTPDQQRGQSQAFAEMMGGIKDANRAYCQADPDGAAVLFAGAMLATSGHAMHDHEGAPQ